MTDETALIVQLPRDAAVDRNLHADPPPSILSGRVVLDHVVPDASGCLGPPQAGQVIMSVLSPEAFTREPGEVMDAIHGAPATDGPLVILVEVAEELREDELAVVADAATSAHRWVILRIMAGS